MTAAYFFPAFAHYRPMLELLKADQKWVKDEVKKRKEIDAAKRAEERKSKKR